MTLAELLLAVLVAMQFADRFPLAWGRRLAREIVPGDDPVEDQALADRVREHID